MTSPLVSLTDALFDFSLPDLADYCRKNPSSIATCKWCGAAIVSTPWFSPSGTFHMASGGWMHEAIESSSCGAAWPYRFAEPK